MCWCIGHGVLGCSFSQFPKDLTASTMYPSGQLICRHLNLYKMPIFCNLLSLSLGPLEVFDGVGPSEVYLDTHVVACPFKPFPQSLDVRYYKRNVFVVRSTVVVLSICWWLNFLYVHFGCCVCGKICYVNCCWPMVGSCRPLGLC